MQPPVEVYNGIDRRFPNGETRVQIPVNVCKRSVYILQPTCPPYVDRAHSELTMLLDAARRASASEIVAVVPDFGYGRQDRKDRPRTAITAALRAREIQAAGATKIMTIDPHSESIEATTTIPWDKFYGSYALVPAIRRLSLQNPVVISPDLGGLRRAVEYSEKLGLGEDVAVIYKRRSPETGKPKAIRLIGDVEDRDVLIVDDIGDTFGTLITAADFAKRNGARDIYAVITHGYFSGSAYDRLERSTIKLVLCTDTVPLRPKVAASSKVEIVSVAELLARAIEYNIAGKSISADLIH